MRISRSSSLPEVAFIVCTALHRGGITAVLTGGSAATVYAPHAYQSRDLDFIIEFRASNSNASETLASLGYRLSGDHYEHAENPLHLEFPPGPLAVGGELIREWDTMQEKGLLLHIITPTDSCRDRLSGFLFWNDRGSLEQAVAVAGAQKERVDFEIIRRWCELEGRLEQYGEFERALRQKRTNNI
ncbi:MAG: hypothetical protein GTO51_00375 [Candidatus Latescibacteria bacterium]|nr:hypothetical protein [Candidatus Latescibacterota bacterium]NIM64437.1 hypothetical protein [Candidatus Latescibacterota bacterium]NIO00591.1 hypothetical protein [Candidatus Latescibacterota bacterium]NIO26991.1 hypothetical protein [Candidatus Latescibacterota bacterium]NIO56068.1 hypothetical protein [Candidatus Latescibacterota bacterium]